MKLITERMMKIRIGSRITHEKNTERLSLNDEVEKVYEEEVDTEVDTEVDREVDGFSEVVLII